MSGANFTLEGDENLKRMFSEFPEFAYRKSVKAGFRKAAEPFKRAVISNIPPNIKPIRKAVKVKPGKGKSLTLAVGIFSGAGVYRNSRGQNWDPFQIAYWHNYGTMANRDQFHRFTTPRRKKTSGRMGGIKPLRFVEKAWDQSQGQIEKIFNDTIDKEVTKFFQERALQ
jgi:hypothetical protein